MTAIDNYLDTTNGVSVDTLNEVVRILAYRDLSEFLWDNPGLIENIFNWIGKQNVTEWNSLLEENTPDEDFEDQDDE